MQSRALLRKAIRAVGAHRREAADRVDGGDERDRRAATRRMADGPRRVTLVAAIVLASGFWTTLRTDGMTGDSRHDLTWRWTETAEARLLAMTTDERLAPPPKKTTTANEADWPGFRGRNRDSIVRGSRLGQVAAGRAVAPARRPGGGLFLGPGASGLHPGATGRSGDGLELSAGDRRAGLATRRPGTILGLARRRRAPRWAAPDGGDSYSSPHLVTLDGVPQVVLLTADGVTSVAPADGRVLWTHDWATTRRIVQPR